MQVAATKLPVAEIVETLQILLARERQLYERMDEDEENRIAMIHAMTCLIAATAHLMSIQAQTTSLEPESPKE